jgi:exosortase A
MSLLQPTDPPPIDSTIQGQETVTLRCWRATALIVIATVVLLIALFWQTAASMVSVWYRSQTFTHGFLVLPISASLIWSHRKTVLPLVPAPTLWGFPLLAVIGFGWLLGNLAQVLVVQQVALVALIQAVVWTTLGTAVTRTLLFPLAFLYFVVPIGEFLIPFLQDFSAFFAVEALKLSGVPVFADGRLIEVPSGTWLVAEACAGVRYVIPAVMLGCLFVSLAYRSRMRQFGFMLAAVAVPVLANGVRVYGIIMLGHLSDMRIAIGVDHLIYGWLFFCVVMGLLFGAGLWWRGAADRRPTDIGRHPQSAALQAVKNDTVGSRFSLTALSLTAAGSVALLALAPLSAQVLLNRAATPVALHAVAPPVTLPWDTLAEYQEGWSPHFIGADAEVLKSYALGSQHVHLYIACYVNEKQGAELVNSENRLVDGKLWKQVAEKSGHALIGGQPLSVRETIIRSPKGETFLVWSWYWVGGTFTSSPYLAKLLQLKTRLLGEPQVAAAIAIGAGYASQQTDAEQTLQDFLRHMSLEATLKSFSEW